MLHSISHLPPDWESRALESYQHPRTEHENFYHTHFGRHAFLDDALKEFFIPRKELVRVLYVGAGICPLTGQVGTGCFEFAALAETSNVSFKMEVMDVEPRILEAFQGTDELTKPVVRSSQQPWMTYCERLGVAPESNAAPIPRSCRRLENVTCTNADIVTSPLEDHSYDLIFALNVLCHIGARHPRHQELIALATMRKLERALTKGGLLLTDSEPACEGEFTFQARRYIEQDLSGHTTLKISKSYEMFAGYEILVASKAQ